MNEGVSSVANEDPNRSGRFVYEEEGPQTVLQAKSMTLMRYGIKYMMFVLFSVELNVKKGFY